MSDSWDDKFADLLERIMAARFAGADPRSLQAEFEQLLNDAPPDKVKSLNLPEKKSHGSPTR